MKHTLQAEEVVIISDFDGTITLQDSNELLFKTLGSEENAEVERLYADGAIGTKEGMLRHFNIMKLTKEQYEAVINSQIDIDNGFKELYDMAEEKGIPIVIVSGGFINAVDLVLKKEGIKLRNVYANSLSFDNTFAEPIFLHEKESCRGSFHACGNCKLFYLSRYRSLGKKVIFIGDGLTDRCIAGQADIVFAKKSLEKFCRDNNIAYNSYKDLHEVKLLLTEMIV